MSENFGLTAKKLLFAQEFLVDLNGAQAAIRAGYSENSARSQASRLLTDENIQAYIAERRKERAEKLEASADNVISEVVKLAFHDIRDMYDKKGNLKSIPELDDMTAATISSFKVKLEKSGEDQYDVIQEYRRYDKLKALELLAKLIGLLDKDSVKDLSAKPEKKRVIIAKRSERKK